MGFYIFCKTVLSYLILVLFRLKIIGKENVPKDGSLLVCANHISMWDPIIISASVNRLLHYMAKVELFSSPILGKFVTAVGAYPVSRSGFDVAAIKTTISFLKDGECVGMFPQGTRNSGKPLRETKVRGGAGMIIMHSQTTVLPVAICTKDNKIKLFRKIYVIIGKPIPYENISTKERTKDEFQRVSDTVFDNICTLFESSPVAK